MVSGCFSGICLFPVMYHVFRRIKGLCSKKIIFQLKNQENSDFSSDWHLNFFNGTAIVSGSAEVILNST